MVGNPIRRSWKWPAVAFLIVAGVIAPYVIYGTGIISREGIGAVIETANAYAPVLQVLIGMVTVGTVVWTGIYFNGKIEKRRVATEEARELVRISERMFDREFYTKITAPMWEIAYKWLYWEGEDGDRYRADVLLGALPANFPAFTNPEDTLTANANLIRFHPHYLPYDHATQDHPDAPINELSEHMVLMTWVRFWVHLDLLVREWKIVGADDVHKAFGGWYSSWAEFSQEFLDDVRAVKRHLKLSKGPDDSMDRFAKIHGILVGTQRATRTAAHRQRLRAASPYMFEYLASQ